MTEKTSMRVHGKKIFSIAFEADSILGLKPLMYQVAGVKCSKPFRTNKFLALGILLLHIEELIG